MDTRHVGFVCVKHGDKFSADHVNRLYRMVEKNISLPFTFYCLTEDPTDIIDQVNILPLDESLGLRLWWWKMCIFKRSYGDVNVYLDLDVVIQNNLDWLCVPKKGIQLVDVSEFIPIDLSILQHYYYNDGLYNSSVMIWSDDQSKLFDKFYSDKDFYMNVYRGMDTYFVHEEDGNNFYPLPLGAVYSRLNGGYDVWLEKNDGDLYFYPNYTVCIFNSAHEKFYYKGFEEYF